MGEEGLLCCDTPALQFHPQGCLPGSITGMLLEFCGYAVLMYFLNIKVVGILTNCELP